MSRDLNDDKAMAAWFARNDQDMEWLKEVTRGLDPNYANEILRGLEDEAVETSDWELAFVNRAAIVGINQAVQRRLEQLELEKELGGP